MLYETPPHDFKKEIDIVGCYMQQNGKFLVLLRHPHKSNGGTWGLPAGKVDPGETTGQAIIREIQEETGISIDTNILTPFRSIYVRHNGHDFEYHMYSVNYDNEPIVALSESEHAEYRWVTPQEALQLSLVEDQDSCIQMFYNIPG